jgi:outer membrane protein
MNKLIKTLSAIGAFCAVALFAHAQAGPKIAIVDIARIYDNHYETVAQNAKLKMDAQKVQEQIDQMNKEGESLVEQYKELQERAKDPTATNDAKGKIVAQANDIGRQIQQKQKDITDLSTQARDKFRQRMETFRNTMLQQITRVATEIAKQNGATLLIDKSGPTLIGIPPVIYADASYEITDQVMAEINRQRPGGAAASIPAPVSSGSDASAPKIVVPGITPQ